MAQYFEKYLKKTLVATQYAHDTVEALLEYLKDTVEVVEEIVRPALPEDADVATFIKLTEHERRCRERRLAAGDESAKLVFARENRNAHGDRDANRGRMAPYSRGRDDGRNSYSSGGKGGKDKGRSDDYRRRPQQLLLGRKGRQGQR